MNQSKDFLSKGSFVSIPNTKNPRVILAIKNKKITINSFLLFNPFSWKGQLLKKILKFVLCHFNQNIFPFLVQKQEESSQFISFLEKKLNTSIVSSLYNATAKDKVVLQLQTTNADIIGYLKFPLNEIGTQRLKVEEKAINLLASKGIIPNYLLYAHYESKPFLISKPLTGSSKLIPKSEIRDLLNKFIRTESYLLKDHPRIVSIKKQLEKHRLDSFTSTLDHITHSSSSKYALVYEHGDFAPWNVISSEQGAIPFDFEYFTENGLEHLDLIKYYYQIGKLLYKKSGVSLLEYLQQNIDLSEESLPIKVFLIKEILQCHIEGKPYSTEANLLNLYD